MVQPGDPFRAQVKQTLRWAITAGRASIAGVVISAVGVGVSIAAILVAIWLSRHG
jgi:hypothetical protein